MSADHVDRVAGDAVDLPYLEGVGSPGFKWKRNSRGATRPALIDAGISSQRHTRMTAQSGSVHGLGRFVG